MCIRDSKYCIHGMNYLRREGKRWLLPSPTLWRNSGAEGMIRGVLKTNQVVSISHRSLDRIVKATVVSIAPVQPPKGVTSPLAR